MATTHFSQSLNGSLDTALVGTAITGLANGAYLMGAAINNTPTDGTTISHDMADLILVLQTAATTGATAPNLIVWILPAVDGTNYPTPPGASAGAAPTSLSYTFQVVPSVATSVIVCPNIPIPPYNFKVQVQFNLGVTLAAMTTSTCRLQRKTIANW